MQAVRIEKNEFTDVWITTGIQGLISSRSKKRFVHGTADAANDSGRWESLIPLSCSPWMISRFLSLFGVLV
jgi:hypothetical protein